MYIEFYTPLPQKCGSQIKKKKKAAVKKLCQVKAETILIQHAKFHLKYGAVIEI